MESSGKGVSRDSVGEPGNETADAEAAAGIGSGEPTDDRDSEEAQPRTNLEGQGVVAYTVHRRPHRRRYQTARDMLLSMGAVGLSVAVILAITWRPKPDPVRVVDAAPAVTDVRLSAQWPVVDPSAGLPPGWRLTVARRDFTPGSAPVLALGWVTPSNHWVGLQQSAAEGRDAIRWRNQFLPDEWSAAVAYPLGSWRAFANLRACTSACAATTAPLAYAQRSSNATVDVPASGTATYIVYGDAPKSELQAVMNAVNQNSALN